MLLIQKIAMRLEEKFTSPQKQWVRLRGFVVANCVRCQSGLLRDVEDFCFAVFDCLEPNVSQEVREQRMIHVGALAVSLNLRIVDAGRDVRIRGVAMIAPCDIGYMAERMSKKELTAFLVGEGLHVLHRKSDEAVVEDIRTNARAMRFANAAKLVGGRKLFLATGDYDAVVPSEPLDALWQQLPNDSKRHVRIRYRADHSLMGVRRALAKALSDFMLEK